MFYAKYWSSKKYKRGKKGKKRVKRKVDNL